jgi:hypothetical protein
MDRTTVLTRRLRRGTAPDVIAALLEQLGAVGDPAAQNAIDAVRAWALRRATKSRVRAWRQAIAEPLADDAAPVRLVSVALLAGRVICATVESRSYRDRDGVLPPGAQALETAIQSALREVTRRDLRECLSPSLRPGVVTIPDDDEE